MKIAILTQPLHTNYGGILQAYALQKVLKDMGHDPWTINFTFNKKNPYLYTRTAIGRFVKKYFLKRDDIKNIFPYSPQEHEYKVILQHIETFIKNNIILTDQISKINQLSVLKSMAFNAYIVGSDQVWRPRYSPNITTFYLDFLETDKSIKKIAYAASFGVDCWEYSNSLTDKCRKLLHLFDAISVREDSGTELCKKYYGINDVAHLLDPTMLLNKEFYEKTVNFHKKSSDRKIVTYILDNTRDKKLLVQNIQNILKKDKISLMPTKNYTNKIKNISEYIFCPVEEWILNILNASFVVTDSFHGCLFSILFNKKFIVVGNKERGLSRITSLLRMFNLEDRMVSGTSDFDQSIIKKDIPYKTVNNIIKDKRNTSLYFLKESLSS